MVEDIVAEETGSSGGKAVEGVKEAAVNRSPGGCLKGLAPLDRADRIYCLTLIDLNVEK
jgi:hypothetical protein